MLSINDGDEHDNFDMDAKQLKTGSIQYTPKTGDVSFIMEVTGKNQSKPVTESVRSLRTRPSPMPEGKAATTAASKTNQAQPAAGAPPAAAQPGAPANTTTPAEATPTTLATPAKPAPKAFDTGSLAQRLHPANATEIADAGLGAAPAQPAGVSVNPSLNVPFGSAPAPVAPAPPSAKKTTLSGGKVASAQLLYRKDPEYPTAARQMNARGNVVLEATIGTDGRVVGVKVISGHPLLVQRRQDSRHAMALQADAARRATGGKHHPNHSDLQRHALGPGGQDAERESLPGACATGMRRAGRLAMGHPALQLFLGQSRREGLGCGLSRGTRPTEPSGTAVNQREVLPSD